MSLQHVVKEAAIEHTLDLINDTLNDNLSHADTVKYIRQYMANLSEFRAKAA